ncbi:MAG TPA: D-2-hydroxyacid dehydrogenase [Noviherbaspirillum sp.]|jgi:phosphoglycerate dehydrogenase-like enzyme|uniref:D-2-hydroxyacid dehydrogenase n=1 Tax=Noviherbaspirillum sp. TaxID=1926288 RepID=UPI002DDCF5A1|nr:D-2-hydroxyacid dehydrogenase [Noviherbaspirillum sp.]HEV2610029.1 D-2-hydroxyacid dehydrogenase [Noviherbaspirillum sp.]
MKMLIFDIDAHYLRDALAAEFPDVRIASATTLAEARPHFSDADIVCALALPHYFSDEWLAGAQRLKWIQALTSGADALRTLTTLPPNLLLTNARGVAGPQMAEMAFLHMLSLTRNFRKMLKNQEAGKWERWPQQPLLGSTVTMIGVGAIAEDIARRCKAFDMRVTGVASSLRDVPWFDLIYTRDQMTQAVSEADYVIVLLPYSADTDRIVDAQVLGAMKRSAYFLNLARGGVVDEDALLRALREGTIAGAGLDVFTVEPLPRNHPFWSMDNVIVTAHVGGMSVNYKDQVLPLIRTNLRHFIAEEYDRMINRVALPV